MRTVVQLANSNCPWCLHTMSDRLLARALVRQLHVNSTTGCLVVDHDHDHPAALVAEIHDNLRGWELADNGEAVMVDLDVHEESSRSAGGPRPYQHQMTALEARSVERMWDEGGLVSFIGSLRL